jgi:hypothetical protein
MMFVVPDQIIIARYIPSAMVIRGIGPDPQLGEPFRQTNVRMNDGFHFIRQIEKQFH